MYAASPIFVWTRENRRQMAEYWALMFLRTTSFYDFEENSAESIFRPQLERLNTDADFRQRLVSHYSLILGRPIAEETILNSVTKAITGLLTKDELRNQYVLNLRRRVDLFSKILLNKPWQVWTVPNGCEFVTCDSPVMTFRVDEWNRYYVGDGFGKAGVIVLLPLSPYTCLLAGQQGTSSKEISRDDVREVNKIIISACSRFVYSRTNRDGTNDLVQEFAGSVRYGVNAFKGDTDLDDFLF